MPEQSLKQLRLLRERARNLLVWVADDLAPFVEKDGSFRRLPDADSGEISVTTTCSCLMCLTATAGIKLFNKNNKITVDTKNLFKKLVDAPWTSSGLAHNNAFTTTLMIRTLGFLLSEHGLVPNTTAKKEKAWALNEEMPSGKKTLSEIISFMAEDPNNFAIGKYSPSATVLYWFLDGIRRADVPLAAENWEKLCSWASTEFNHQLSLVAADHDAMMDPVAMAMSACLCARMRTLCRNGNLGASSKDLYVLPSELELERSIAQLFDRQATSGIWNKYFPLFHYVEAGSNFCFTFEMLDAVLSEFSTEEYKLFDNPQFVAGLERAVTWCENNRLKCLEGNKTYAGWNSGGVLSTLRKSQPESWATAMVHMFLIHLEQAISCQIQEKVLVKYGARRPKEPGKQTSPPYQVKEKLWDTDVLIKRTPEKLTDILVDEIIVPCGKIRIPDRSNGPHRPVKIPKGTRLSALLFGPPGTSKTMVVQSIADDLNWPLVELDPSDFVRESLSNVYSRADEIFEDLSDLSGVIVFFDEMDALVQTRDGETHLDITSQFLTTTMLPKLAKLHNERRVLFFMATNFQDRFDAAIKRAGRFDLLLCMGPPTSDQKLAHLELVNPVEAHSHKEKKAKTEQSKKASEKIAEYLRSNQELADAFELFSYGDFDAFVKSLPNDGKLGDKLELMGKDNFLLQLKDASKYVGLKMTDLDVLAKIDGGWKTLEDLKKLTFTQAEAEAAYELVKMPVPWAARYLCDWQQSKKQ